MLDTVIVMPTYNEASNLPQIAGEIFALNLDGVGILVVDDASPDGTGQVADGLAKQYPDRLHVMHRSGKLGLGTAYVQGFTWAMEQGASHVISMDADFSHSPSYLPKMLELIREYDVVIGSRYTQGGRLDEKWGFGRRFLSWWANSVWIRVLLGTKVADATAGFRCWCTSALRAIGLENIQSSGYVFEVELTYIAERLGLHMIEIPIYFEERRLGASKMDMKIKIEAALRVIEIRRRLHHLKPR